MPQNLARRQYQELIKFLKTTITNEAATLKLRMIAAEKLEGIYARAEERESKALDRAYRLEVRRLEAQAAKEAAKTSAMTGSIPTGESEEDKIARVWSTMQGRQADGE